MTHRLYRLIILAALVLPPLALAGAPRAAAAPAYTITDLGALPPPADFGARYTPESYAYGLNAAGQVVGWSGLSGSNQYTPKQAFLYAGGAMTGLAPGRNRTFAYAINDHGQAVGEAYFSQDASHAVLWQGGAMTDLGALGGTYSVARDINAGAQIVGSSTTGAGDEHAFLWLNGRMTDLGTLGGPRSYAMAINAAGQVVGAADTNRRDASGRVIAHAFLWQNGAMTDLGTLPGADDSDATAINDAGQVTGSSGDRAFLWRDGAMVDLGKGLDPRAMNNVGQIVGGPDGAPVIWQNSRVADLNTLVPPSSGWTLKEATAINDQGQIAGNGTVNGAAHAFLLTPTAPPPPAKQCFAATGKCIQGRFLAYWQAHGGLAINGYPISDEFTQTLEDGKPYTVQYFERVRMEYHPENADPQYQVLLGQFGRHILAGVSGAPTAPGSAKDGYTYFAQTGHNVGPQFLAFWQANGGLAQFGYPLSEAFTQTLEDGKPYTVQYFERARFEAHPENQAPYDVELGQFGRRILQER